MNIRDSQNKRLGAELPAHIDKFSRLLARHGVHVLGCGGGVIPEPRWAIERLRDKYTESDLLDQCLELCLLPEPLSRRLPGEIWRTVHGILVHLGNEETLEQIIAHYPNSEEAHHKATFKRANYYCLGSLESLISGLSKKLGRLPPEGIDRFSDFDCRHIFCPDNYPDRQPKK